MGGLLGATSTRLTLLEDIPCLLSGEEFYSGVFGDFTIATDLAIFWRTKWLPISCLGNLNVQNSGFEVLPLFSAAQTVWPSMCRCVQNTLVGNTDKHDS